MSKGTYSYSNRHRMHEPQVTNFDEVANLKGIIEELKRTLSKSMYALQENEELNKDKERLDWLLQSRYRGELETREAIDKAFDAGFELEDDE